MTETRQGGPANERDIIHQNGSKPSDYTGIKFAEDPDPEKKSVFQFWFGFCLILSLFLTCIATYNQDIWMALGIGIVTAGLASVEIKFGILHDLFLK